MLGGFTNVGRITTISPFPATVANKFDMVILLLVTVYVTPLTNPPSIDALVTG